MKERETKERREGGIEGWRERERERDGEKERRMEG